MATITGTGAGEFIHRAGDGHTDPLSRPEITSVTQNSDSISGGGGDDLVYASDGADTVLGGKGADVLYGELGSDWLDGGKGDDTLYGGAFADTLKGGQGQDVMDGGAQQDTYYVRDAGDVAIDTGSDFQVHDTVKAWVDYTLLAGIERLVLKGSAVVGTGNADDNKITGNDQDNVLNGDDGNDVLLGGAGDDTLNGGLGSDQVTGGSGADIFRYQSVDDANEFTAEFILDFELGVDKVDLSAIDADTTTDGNQSFHLGGSSFTNSAGELIQVENGGDIFLVGDVDGDGNLDLVIELDGGPTLAESDIIL